MFLQSVVPLVRKGSLLPLASLLLTAISSRADVVVDYSPDTTGAPVYETAFVNTFGSQVIGGSFTLDDETAFSGASIFRADFAGANVGNTVKVLVFSNPSESPVVSFDAIVDAVDSLYTTSQSSMLRVHASFDEFTLAAGSYWFAMPTVGGTGSQATGVFMESSFRLGNGSTLSGSSDEGKPFFQLESSAVPEPGSASLLALGSCVVLFGWRKRR